MTKIDKYTFDGAKKLTLSDLPTNAKEDKVEKKEIKKLFKDNLKEMKLLQEKLYADGKEGLIVVVQALDTAGKDSTIKKVMTAFNPQGCACSVSKFRAAKSSPTIICGASMLTCRREAVFRFSTAVTTKTSSLRARLSQRLRDGKAHQRQGR